MLGSTVIRGGAMINHRNSCAHDFFRMEHFNLPLEETLKVLICCVWSVQSSR